MSSRATLALCLIAAPSLAAADPAARLDEAARAALEALAGLRATVEPWADALARYLDEPQAYFPPEIGPDGDITLRRRPAPSPSPEPPAIDL